MFSRNDNKRKHKSGLGDRWGKKNRHRKHDNTKTEMEKKSNMGFGNVRHPVPIIMTETNVDGTVRKTTLPYINLDALPSTSSEKTQEIKEVGVDVTNGEHDPSVEDEKSSDDYLDKDEDEDEADFPKKALPDSDDEDTDSNIDNTCLYKSMSCAVHCCECIIL